MIKAIALTILLSVVSAPETPKEFCTRICKEASEEGKYVRSDKCSCFCIDGNGEFEVMIYDCPRTKK